LIVPDIVKDAGLLLIIFFFFMAIHRLLIRSYELKTSSPAVVMAGGIFLESVHLTFPADNGHFEKVASLALFLLWLWLIVVCLKEMIRKKDRDSHLGHPLRSFAVGTWVAATSVCGTIFCQQIPEMKDVAYAMAVLDAALWLFFFWLVLRNFIKVFKGKLYRKIHGIVLFSTVATQSVVIFYDTLFNPSVLHVFSDTFLIIGAFFYITGFILIFNRYSSERDLDLKRAWTNTNCILHGGMSITGVASILSHSVPKDAVLIIWIWCLVWFIIVECIELIRAVKRIKALGATEGIGTYDVSQWCRNFTFGMFLVFTMKANLSGEPFFLQWVRNGIVSSGTLIIFLLLFCETVLFFKKNSDVFQESSFLFNKSGK